MKKKKLITLSVALFLCTIAAFAGPRLVKVKLTGSIDEDIEMTVGRSGRKEVISHLPYVFQVAKEDLPITLTFRSEHYSYVSIDVPKKAVDNIGHVYLLKKQEMTYMQPMTNVRPALLADNQVEQVKGIDTSYGVNAAPFTGKKAENTFAVIIANENYEMASKVEMAQNDGLAMKEYCSKTFGLTDRQIIYCPDATYGKMKKAVRDFKNIAASYNGKCNLIFYYAGHGIPDNTSKEAYLMPTDADGTDPSVCYSLKNLYQEIDDMKLNQAVVFLDACFSGANRDGGMIVAARGVAIKPKEAKPASSGNTVVFSATSDEETAFPYKAQKHGLFTYFLLKCLQEEKGKVKLGELADYLKKNVSQQSVLINGKKQTPTVIVPQAMADWRDAKITDQ